MRSRRNPFERLREAFTRHPFITMYTRGLTSEDLQRLFTRDTVEADKFFTKGIDPAEIARLGWHRRLWAHAKDSCFTDDQTILALRRILAPPGQS